MFYNVLYNAGGSPPIKPVVLAPNIGRAFFQSFVRRPTLKVGIASFSVVAAAVTSQGWEVDWNGATAKPVTAAQLDFGGFAPYPTTPVETTPQGASNFVDVAKQPPLNAAQQQYESFTAAGDLVSTPQGFERFFDSVQVKPLAPAQQRYEAFQPQGDILSVTPQGFKYFFDRATIAPVNLTLLQFATLSLEITAQVQQPAIAAAFFSNLRVVPSRSGFDTEGAVELIPQPYIGGISFFNSIVQSVAIGGLETNGGVELIARPYIQNTSVDFVRRSTQPPPLGQLPLTTAAAAVTYNYGWAAAYDQQPIRRALGAVRYEAFQARGDVVSETPQGWERFFDSVTIKPLVSAQQRYDGFDPSGQLVSVTPQGFEPNFFDRVTIKPLDKAQQQWEAFTPAGFILITPTNWGYPFFYDRITVQPFPISKQQFDYWQSRDGIVSFTPQGWERFFDSVRINPTNPAEQQWIGLPEFVEPTVITTPVVKSSFSIIVNDTELEQGPGQSVPAARAVEEAAWGWTEAKELPPARPPLLPEHDKLVLYPTIAVQEQPLVSSWFDHAIKPQFKVAEQPSFLRFVVQQPLVSSWFDNVVKPQFKIVVEQPFLRTTVAQQPLVSAWFDHAIKPQFKVAEQPSFLRFIAAQQPLVSSWFDYTVKPMVKVVVEQPVVLRTPVVHEQPLISAWFDYTVKPMVKVVEQPSFLLRTPTVVEQQPLVTSWFDHSIRPRAAALELDKLPHTIAVQQPLVSSWFDLTRPKFRVAEQPTLLHFVAAPKPLVTSWFDVVTSKFKMTEQPVQLHFVPPAVSYFSFAQIETQLFPGVVQPPQQLASLVIPVSVPEAEIFTGWSSELSTVLFRQFGPPVDIISSLRFIKLRGFLVCADLTVAPAIFGELVLAPALDGSFTMTPELQAALSIDPTVSATLVLTPELLAELGIDPAVIATLKVKEC